MDLRQLQYFVAIVEHGSYARAAAAFDVTQSALTQGIARLERNLQCRLFARGRFGAELTDAGRLLLPRAKLIASEAAIAQSELRETKGAAHPRVTFGVGKSVPYDIVPTTIGRILQKAPDMAITVVEGWSPDLYQRLLHGDLDFVVSAPLPQIGVDLDLIQEPLFHQREAPVVGVGHPLSTLQEVALRDLAAHVWLAPPKGNDGRVRYLQRVFQDAGFDPPTRFLRTDSNYVGLYLLKRGELLCHGILEIVSAYLQPDEFRVLPIPELTFQRTVSLTQRRRTRMQAAATLVAAELRTVCLERQHWTPTATASLCP